MKSRESCAAGAVHARKGVTTCDRGFALVPVLIGDIHGDTQLWSSEQEGRMNFPCENKLCKTPDDPDRGSLRCSRCRFAWYCSEECQKQDYRHHKSECAQMSKPENREHTQSALRIKTGVRQMAVNKELALQLLEQAREKSVLSVGYKRPLPPERRRRGVLVNVVNSEANSKQRDASWSTKVEQATKRGGAAAALLMPMPEVFDESSSYCFVPATDERMQAPSMGDVRDLLTRYDPLREFVVCHMVALDDGAGEYHVAQIVRPSAIGAPPAASPATREPIATAEPH